MRRIISSIFFLCLTSALWAQDVSSLKYKGLVDLETGIAYNLNTAQTVSTNNMQFFTTVTTTHGIQFKQYFVGLGLGYMHSYRDKENIYPFYWTFRYAWEKVRLHPFADIRLGIVYDPYWISTVQAYGTMSVGVEVYKKLQVGCRATIFSRPSRYFTANASVVLGYSF